MQEQLRSKWKKMAVNHRKHLHLEILHDVSTAGYLGFAKTYGRIRKRTSFGQDCIGVRSWQSFGSKLVTELGQLCSSKHKKRTGYHPQTNELTERFNKTLEDMLSMYVGVEQTNWDEILFVTFAYYTAKQETTGYTPFYLLHGREAEITLDTVFPYIAEGSEDDYVSRLITRAEESRHLARIRTLEAQHRNKTRYDARHRSVSYRPGELVKVLTPEEAQERILTNGTEKLPSNSPADATYNFGTDKRYSTRLSWRNDEIQNANVKQL
ncbi:transposon Ty3-I Gag-Pol polyprotein [Trichonephila clavipes]|nr:transposon Ty3-I Gag-Pol polyprotein [Trichonephila clavipes]